MSMSHDAQSTHAPMVHFERPIDARSAEDCMKRTAEHYGVDISRLPK